MARCIAPAISRLILKLFVVKHNMDRWVVGQLELAKSTCLTEPSADRGPRRGSPAGVVDAPDAGVKLRSRKQEDPFLPWRLAPAVCFRIRGTRRASEIHP
jgi:hypothetical protein